jgi:glycosyltransferase involved in cell wall biosynthesis
MTAGRSADRLNICIVSHLAFGAMTGGRRGHAGGVEHQTSLTARWLAARGHTVSLIVWDEGQPQDIELDGVRVIKACAREAGVPVVRFVHPRWTSLVGALARANASVYYHNCAEYVTGQVALWCRLHRRRFVYSVASDPECDPALPALHHVRERVLFRYGLRHADLIIAQTETQREALVRGFGLDSIVLPMPCPGPLATEELPPFASDAPRVVWIGRLSHEKRPEWIASIARQVPHVQFDVVGPAVPEHASALAQLEALPNVSIRGRIARTEMPAVYRGAAALLCTSLYEGFPNTFLEAWSHGIPVVSTVDPDGLIARHGLGRVAGDEPSLARSVEQLLAVRDTWHQASVACRRYYERHRPEQALPLFEAAFASAARPLADRAAVSGLAETGR